MTTESNAQFIVRAMEIDTDKTVIVSGAFFKRLRDMAEERVMVEEHMLWVDPPRGLNTWRIVADGPNSATQKNLSRAIRNCVAKIKESP